MLTTINRHVFSMCCQVCLSCPSQIVIIKFQLILTNGVNDHWIAIITANKTQNIKSWSVVYFTHFPSSITFPQLLSLFLYFFLLFASTSSFWLVFNAFSRQKSPNNRQFQIVSVLLVLWIEKKIAIVTIFDIVHISGLMYLPSLSIPLFLFFLRSVFLPPRLAFVSNFPP